ISTVLLTKGDCNHETLCARSDDYRPAGHLKPGALPAFGEADSGAREIKEGEIKEGKGQSDRGATEGGESRPGAGATEGGESRPGAGATEGGCGCRKSLVYGILSKVPCARGGGCSQNV